MVLVIQDTIFESIMDPDGRCISRLRSIVGTGETWLVPQNSGNWSTGHWEIVLLRDVCTPEAKTLTKVVAVVRTGTACLSASTVPEIRRPESALRAQQGKP
ncbi:hypothetical protein NDU88_007722 [Pleurodeles waltl]|uniref:Uncharacterized protein n=1 Tax=Pleurodeles waltl TaxID=8319 RepID=A0AAV7NXE0_PLEWA|nr:hypothetical protein NDU88_007722 [Pleurodeles waltl]